MRGPPFGNRGGPGGYSRDPYPNHPPPPAYMRERMDGYVSFRKQCIDFMKITSFLVQGGYGYGGYGPRGMEGRGDPYRGDPMYDRRAPYPNGGRDMGGPGPMRGPDPYAG